MNVRRTLVALSALPLLLLPAAAPAAVDPDLVALDAKVRVLGSELNVSRVQLQVHIAQHLAGHLELEQAYASLGDNRRRDLERLLLACSREPEKCVPPGFVFSLLDPECSERPNPNDPHQHAVGFTCPLREVLETVGVNLAAVSAQGLARDVARAEAELDDAYAAAQAGDGWGSFSLACSAYRRLACR